MSETFTGKLLNSVETRESLLCVGLDPQMDIPFEDDVETTIIEFTSRIISETAEYAACFKPNIAFYEQFGPEGLIALKKTLDLIPGDTPVIMDAKRSDIGNTARAYAQSIFGNYNADAVTLNGYMGRESVDPFLAYEGKGVFLLCRTSNPGAEAIQTLPVLEKGVITEMYLKTAVEMAGWSPEVGLVVAGNLPAALRAVRKRLPGTWFLAPGIGAQGGRIDEALLAGIGQDGHNILLNVSRGISDASSPGRKAREMRDMINQARTRVILPVRGIDTVQESKKELIREIIDAGCFKLGDFTLKSGKKSPFYIDLRQLISHPGLLAKVAAAYASLIEPLDCRRVAGIPLAALSFATLAAQQLQLPLLIPRLTRKAHGTGKNIEGSFSPGERVVMLDDLITRGTSALEALEILKEEKLVVKDFVVLLERGASGRKAMEEAGVQLHSFLKISDIFDVCLEMNLIDREKRMELEAYIKD